MAKVSVLDPHQSIGDPPVRQVRRIVADMLLRQNRAEFMKRGLIRMKAIMRALTPAEVAQLQTLSTLPTQMPPREIPGVYFKPPERKPISLHTAAQCLNAQ